MFLPAWLFIPAHTWWSCRRAEPSAGNGAEFETYSWSQTLGDVSLTVPLPRGVKGRDCDVSIMKDKLRVRHLAVSCVASYRPPQPTQRQLPPCQCCVDALLQPRAGTYLSHSMTVIPGTFYRPGHCLVSTRSVSARHARPSSSNRGVVRPPVMVCLHSWTVHAHDGR